MTKVLKHFSRRTPKKDFRNHVEIKCKNPYSMILYVEVMFLYTIVFVVESPIPHEAEPVYFCSSQALLSA